MFKALIIYNIIVFMMPKLVMDSAWIIHVMFYNIIYPFCTILKVHTSLGFLLDCEFFVWVSPDFGHFQSDDCWLKWGHISDEHIKPNVASNYRLCKPPVCKFRQIDVDSENYFRQEKVCLLFKEILSWILMHFYFHVMQ